MIRLQRFAALPQPKTRFSPSKLSTEAVIGQSEKNLAGYLLTNRSSTSLTISRWPSSAFPPPKEHQMLHQLLVVSKYPNHEKPILPTSYQYLLCLLGVKSAFNCILHSGSSSGINSPKRISPSKLCCATTTSGAALCRAAAASRGTPRRSAARRRCRSSAGRVLATRQVPVRWLLKREWWKGWIDVLFLDDLVNWCFLVLFWTETRWFHADGNCKNIYMFFKLYQI